MEDKNDIMLVDKTVNGSRVTKEYTPGCVTETIYTGNSEPLQHKRSATDTDLIQIGVTLQMKHKVKQQYIIS